MANKFDKALSVIEKQKMILNVFNLKEDDCVRVCTVVYAEHKREDSYKIVKIKNSGYILKLIGGDYIAPLTNLLIYSWVKVPQIIEFGNCKCEDVDCKECPLLYVNFDCSNRYVERHVNSNNLDNLDTESYSADEDIKAKRNATLYKSRIRKVYDDFVSITYPSKYKCLINWNAVSMELEKSADAIEENGVTYFKKYEKERNETE